MQPRLRLDVTAADLVFALGACARPLDRSALEHQIAEAFGGEPAAGALVTLSARSALDAALASRALAPGSEVLCSGLNVPDMARVIEAHGLVCVPVDIDLATLAPLAESIQRNAGPRTRALLVAHLFGARAPIDGALRNARQRGWFVIEDAAQAWAGARFGGHPDADVTLFSFGPIKTATALGTGVARVRDAELLARMRAHVANWLPRSRWSFARRVLKFALLLALTRPRLYGGLVRALERTGGLEERLGSLVRGFPPEQLFAALRRQPSPPQVALLARRVRDFDEARLARRIAHGEQLRAQLRGRAELPGAEALERTHWVQPVLVDDPARLAAELREHGFDSATRATLGALKGSLPPGPSAANAERFVQRVVYLPNGPDLRPCEVERLGQIVLRTTAV